MLSSGRIGQPVNVRLHWQFESGCQSLESAAITAAALADTVLTLELPEWTVRRNKSLDSAKGLLNLLGRDTRGRTLLITLASADSPELSLTVYGNHGVARLNGAHLIGTAERPPDWLADLEQTLCPSIP